MRSIIVNIARYSGDVQLMMSSPTPRDPELQRVRWPRVARVMAEQYHVTVSQLKRAAPWAERIWREETALFRQERRLQEQLAARFAPGA